MKNYWIVFKKKISRFLEELAKENKETFGSGKLDCCQLNKNDQNIKKH